MRKMSFRILLVCILMIAAVQVQAFDGDRQGFMLNLGMGFGKAEITGSSNSVSVSTDENGFGGDFKLGGGINPQTMIYYTNRTLFYTVDSTSLVNGMSAVGVSYFLQPQVPSFFFSGAMGIGVFLDDDADESESGFGCTVGIGYEFSKNWIIEGTYMSAQVAEETGVDLSISNLMVTVSWLAY